MVEPAKEAWIDRGKIIVKQTKFHACTEPEASNSDNEKKKKSNPLGAERHGASNQTFKIRS